ncbi:MAG: leucine--tRNA ligase, partial [Candidatus Nanopelagicaceae bacterium]
LGHKPSVALAGWPTVDASLLVADNVTAVLQVNGKIKERIEVDPEISDPDLEAKALANTAIIAALNGVQPIKIITKAPKLVNIVIPNN